jgi:hypothetical protein
MVDESITAFVRYIIPDAERIYGVNIFEKCHNIEYIYTIFMIGIVPIQCR